MSKPQRYFLDQDHSSHWYIVPVANASEWFAWLDIPEDDKRSWETPPFARSLGGSATLVEFENPTIDGETL